MREIENEIKQWFSTFIMLQVFYTVTYVMENLIIKLFLLLPNNFNFATVMNNEVNDRYVTPVKGLFNLM